MDLITTYLSKNAPNPRRIPDVLPVRHWEQLANAVRAYRPNVVVLVARKMPRVVELLRLDFGRDCIVLSDLAIPFAHRFLKDARVAVLDDIVNVGSTIKHAGDCARACGAADVKFFALGRKANRQGDLEVTCVFHAPLETSAYQEMVDSVPEALMALAKPYDLVFPTMPCRLNVPFRTTGQVVAWLKDRFGTENVHLISRQMSSLGLGRVTVDLQKKGSPTSGNYKLRLYLDEAARLCNVVPFSIPPQLHGYPNFETEAARRLWNRLEAALVGVPADACLLAEGEARCMAFLFTQSLDEGLRVLSEIGDIVTLRTPAEYDEEDASLLFGPAAISTSQNSKRVVPQQIQPFEEAKCMAGTSPFLAHFGEKLTAEVQKKVKGGDAFAYFISFFAELADLVGAANPELQKVGDWPYGAAQISKTPYLRLRIGPTFDDLVSIMAGLVGDRDREPGAGDDKVSSMRRTVSTLLDYSIDSGAVVPTIARYDNQYFRVYRKGEKTPRDKAQARVLYAWYTSDRPMSLTECSKINTIISFAADYEQVLAPSALVRGNVATLQESFLDTEAAEITHFLRDTGKLKEVGQSPRRGAK